MIRIRDRRVGLASLALVIAAVTSMTSLPGATAQSPSRPSAPSNTRGGSAAVPPVRWTPCDNGFFCANVRVPLDYDRPSGPTITLALAKLPATDPSRRIGSVFLNPGGPGGSGVDFLLDGGRQLFTSEVRARFDLVGFDPRGIYRSTPLNCFPTEEAAAAASPPFPYPNTAAEERTWNAAQRQLQEACAQRGGPIQDHMSTANVARDLDRLRQAVGDDKLTYYGVSYGSQLGNVYANLFPNRFRALVIDGVLDPVAWTTGRGSQGSRVPFSARLRSATGAQETLNEFLRLCDAGRANCAFGPNAGARYAALYQALRRQPLIIPGEDGAPATTFDETFLAQTTLGPLYRTTAWPALAELLVELESAVRTRRASAGLTAARVALQDVSYANDLEGFPGVGCTDSINPRSPSAWRRAADASLRREGIFGPVWTYASSACSAWPGRDRDRYLDPFTRRTAAPVLVVGNRFDPATPYSGAIAVSRLLPNSRLLTLQGWGHTTLSASSCIDAAIARYLVTSKTPPRGTVCRPDTVPFAQPAPEARRAPADPAPLERPRW